MGNGTVCYCLPKIQFYSFRSPPFPFTKALYFRHALTERYGLSCLRCKAEFCR